MFVEHHSLAVCHVVFVVAAVAADCNSPHTASDSSSYSTGDDNFDTQIVEMNHDSSALLDLTAFVCSHSHSAATAAHFHSPDDCQDFLGFPY